MRRITLFIAAILGVLSAGGLIFVNVINRPAAVEVILAVDAIPAGTPLHAAMFRVVRWTDVDPADSARFVSAAQFPNFENRLLANDLAAGAPLLQAQIVGGIPDNANLRLASVITDATAYYFVLPATPDQIGNWVQPNDRIDLLISVGTLEASELRTVLPTPDYIPPAQIRADDVPSVTLAAPMSKLVLQNLRVLRVDRSQSRRQDAVQTNALGGSTDPAAQEDAPPEDVLRVYVEVTRDQLEILTFVKHNGEHDFAVRAATNSTVQPSLGVAWEDFARWFFEQRGNHSSLDVRPFAAAGPYTSTIERSRKEAP